MNWLYIYKTVMMILGGSVIVVYSFKYVYENSKKFPGWSAFLKTLGIAVVLSFLVFMQEDEEGLEISIIIFLIILIPAIIAHRWAQKKEND